MGNIQYPKELWVQFFSEEKPNAVLNASSDKSDCPRGVRYVYGATSLNISHCVHCGGITLNDKTGICACGSEINPISKVISDENSVYIKSDQIRKIL